MRPLNTTTALILLGMLAAGASTVEPAQASEPASKRPNLFLIVADTLRADHLGSYGYPKDTSPNVDRFAAESIVFEKCFAHASATRTSVASLLTGSLPHETQLPEDFPLPAAAVSLAETLQGAGYTTLAVVSNYVLNRDRGWAQGFDVYDDEMDSFEANRSWPERRAESTTRRAIELLDAHREDPIFMWIHFQDPHGPYTPPEEYRLRFRDADRAPKMLRRNARGSGRGGIPSYQFLGGMRDFYKYEALYDGEIRYMDDFFGALVEHLKTLGLYEDSLILFTSDHGEAMGERDLYFAHGEYLYENLTRVPMVLRPGRAAPARRRELCQQIDVVPTVLGFAGLQVDERLRGRDLTSAPLPPPEILAYTRSLIDHDGAKHSIVADGFKLIRNVRSGRIELFDLAADPREEHDKGADPAYLARRRKLERRLDEMLADDRLQLDAAEAPPLSAEELRLLRSLGYLE